MEAGAEAGQIGGPWDAHQNAMSSNTSSLHGNTPDTAHVALLLIDVINDLEFPEADQLLEHALPMARRIQTLKRRAIGAGVPTIYVNDNFGRWQSNFNHQIEHCLGDGIRGKPIVELLRPGKEDYFVLKPKNSGFYSTVLDILLRYLGVRHLILTGIAGNNCVLFTAHDAYLRDFNVIVPRDCVASNTEAENRMALEQMEELLKADVRPSADLDLDRLNQAAS
jgi:nicotinamidase-related amidase